MTDITKNIISPQLRWRAVTSPPLQGLGSIIPIKRHYRFHLRESKAILRVFSFEFSVNLIKQIEPSKLVRLNWNATLNSNTTISYYFFKVLLAAILLDIIIFLIPSCRILQNSALLSVETFISLG